MKKAIYISAISLVLLTLTSVRLQEVSKPSVKGKWYHVTTGNYYKDTDRKDISRWFEFGPGNKIKFSSCTDVCGCMRETLMGSYEWSSNNVIVATFTKAEHDLMGNETFETPKIIKYQITAIKGNGLKISRIKEG